MLYVIQHGECNEVDCDNCPDDVHPLLLTESARAIQPSAVDIARIVRTAGNQRRMPAQRSPAKPSARARAWRFPVSLRV